MTRARLALVLLCLALTPACKSEPIALGLNLEGAFELKVALAMSQLVTEERDGEEFESAQDVILQWSQTVEDVRPDGSAVLALAYERARLAVSNPSFGTVTYDSAAPPDVVPLLAIGLHAAVGETVRLVVDERGEILKVPGIETFADRIYSKLALPPSMDGSAARNTLRQWFSEDAMREMMRPIFSIYPDGLVQTGDSWQREVTVQRPFPHKQINHYELVDVDAGTATIRVTSELEPLGEARVDYPGGVSAVFDIEGSLEGRLLLHRLSGLVLLGEMVQELEGTVTYFIPNENPVEASLELEGSIEYAVDI